MIKIIARDRYRNRDRELFARLDAYFAERDILKGKKRAAQVTGYLVPHISSKYTPHQGKKELARRALRYG